MKKRLCVVAAIFLVLFIQTGCSALSGLNAENINLEKAFSLTAEIKYQNADIIKGTFERTSVGIWKGVLTEPFALQGISLDYTNGALVLSCAGISVEPSGSGVIAARLMFDALESAFTKTAVDIKAAGASIEVSGINGNGAYILTIDKTTGLPISMTVPDRNLSISFTEVTAADFNAVSIEDAVDFDEIKDFE